VVEEDLIMGMKKITTREELDAFKDRFEEYIRSKNYNNSLIVELIRSDEYKELFVFFLEERAREWIKTSKINDKDSHLEALEEYLSGGKTERGLAKFRILKYRKMHSKKDLE